MLILKPCGRIISPNGLALHKRDSDTRSTPGFMVSIGREGGSTATNVGGKICHSKNWPKVEGYETVFYPIGRSEILTAKRRRTEKAVV